MYQVSLIIRYLKKSYIGVLLIIVFLLVKVVCDLALPYYTSTIVNVGIQQGGIESVIPSYVSIEGYETLSQTLPKSEAETIKNSYTLTDSFYTLTKKDQNLESIFLSYFSKVDQDADEKKQYLSAIIGVTQEYEKAGIDVLEIQQRYILSQGMVMVGISLLSALFSILVSFFASRTAASTGRHLRGEVFSKVLTFHQNEIDHFSTASLITRSTNDVQQIQQSLVMILRIVFFAPLMAIGGIIRVLATNNSMTWIIALAVGLIFIVVITMFRLVMPKFTLLQNLVDNINSLVRETLKGLSVIRAFSNQDHEKKRFNDANEKLTSTSLFVNRSMSAMMPIMMLIMNLTGILIVWVGGIHISQGDMQVGDMMAFIQYSMIIIMSFLMITMLSIIIPRSTVSAKRIEEVLNTNPSIVDAKELHLLAKSDTRTIELRNVSFTYPKADTEAIKNISFVCKPGTITAIIGSTGSGKSTILQLLPRFIDPTMGSVLIDGIDTKTISLHELRENIGYVSQVGNLFKGTIKSNIGFGEKEISDEDIKEAAVIAQAHDFILEKESGYESNITLSGTNVSGGQRQRISIARAIATKAPILLFDDSFSALDFRTEVSLRKELRNKITDSTIIIVGQRISSIMHSDTIIVLDEGKMVGIGTHKELMKTCEVYQQISRSQLSPEELKTYE
jgi:ATP-binding cassette subfamily B protein